MSARDAHHVEVARSFREATLNRIRWRLMAEELERHDDIPDTVVQLCLACRAVTELFYRAQSRRAFLMFDVLTTDILPKEGEAVTDGQRMTLLAKAEWHRKLAAQARKEGGIDHAAMHQRLAESLISLARHGAPPELKPAKTEQPKPAQWAPGKRSII